MAVWRRWVRITLALGWCVIFAGLDGSPMTFVHAQSAQDEFGIISKTRSKPFVYAERGKIGLQQVEYMFIVDDNRKFQHKCKDGMAEFSYRLSESDGNIEFSNGNLINSRIREFFYLNKDNNIVLSYEHNGYYVTTLFVDASYPFAAGLAADFRWVGSKKELAENAAAKKHYDVIRANPAFFLGHRKGQMPVAAIMPDISTIDPRLLPAGWDMSPAGKLPKGTASTTASPKTGVAAVAGQSFRDCDTRPEMVVLPAASFLMGSSVGEEGRGGDDGPAQNVTFARSFAIGKFEVTHDEWSACVTEGDCPPVPVPPWSQGRRPVSGISWMEAQLYVAWLSKKTGLSYFLTSESEWEYAARAGTTTPWNTDDAIITNDANILDQFKQPVPFGGFPPTAFGLHDMHSNV